MSASPMQAHPHQYPHHHQQYSQLLQGTAFPHPPPRSSPSPSQQYLPTSSSRPNLHLTLPIPSQRVPDHISLNSTPSPSPDPRPQGSSLNNNLASVQPPSPTSARSPISASDTNTTGESSFMSPGSPGVVMTASMGMMGMVSGMNGNSSNTEMDTANNRLSSGAQSGKGVGRADEGKDQRNELRPGSSASYTSQPLDVSDPSSRKRISPLNTNAANTYTNPNPTSTPDADSPSHPDSAVSPGFSLPSLHLGSFSSLKLGDFGFGSPTSPNFKPSNLPGSNMNGEGPSCGSGAAAEMDNGNKSPSLYDVMRMGRTGSPFRPISRGSTNRDKERDVSPTGDSLKSRGKSRLAGDEVASIRSGRSGDLGLGRPVSGAIVAGRNISPTSPTKSTMGTRSSAHEHEAGDMIIDAPDFIEPGSTAFLRQSRINRRRTIVQEPGGAPKSPSKIPIPPIPDSSAENAGAGAGGEYRNFSGVSRAASMYTSGSSSQTGTASRPNFVLEPIKDASAAREYDDAVSPVKPNFVHRASVAGELGVFSSGTPPLVGGEGEDGEERMVNEEERRNVEEQVEKNQDTETGVAITSPRAITASPSSQLEVGKGYPSGPESPYTVKKRRLPSTPSGRSTSGTSYIEQARNGREGSSSSAGTIPKNKQETQDLFDKGGSAFPLPPALPPQMGNNYSIAGPSRLNEDEEVTPKVDRTRRAVFTAEPAEVTGDASGGEPLPADASQNMAGRGVMTSPVHGLDEANRRSIRTPPRPTAALPPSQSQADAGDNLDTIPAFPTYLNLNSGMGNEGPYPSYARPSKEPSAARQSGEFARQAKAKAGGAGDGVPLRVKIPPPQEEICLECLMRDRDLMHVDVTGDGVWDRQSDVDWHERLEREDELLGKIRGGGASNHGSDRGTSESYLMAEEDELIIRKIGWRGFSWEEKDGLRGYPRGFRGKFGGPLLEVRLKELATKMVAPSAHRFKTLQIYLRDQAQLVGLSHDPAQFADAESPKPRRIASQIPASSSLYRENMAPGGNYGGQPQHGLRSHRSQGVLADVTDWQNPSTARRPGEHAYSQVPPQHRSTMYADSDRMTGGLHAPIQNQAYTRSRTSPAIAINEPPSSMSQDRDPRYARPQVIPLDLRKGRGISSPGLLENMSPQQGYAESFADSDRMYGARQDPGDQSSPNESPIRPFSFAVWAGHGGHGPASARSSPGPGGRERKNSGVIGRWGGSVISLFGGSQGGVSGSMMDMHLGLDHDRRNNVSTPLPHQHPRSVSMASPPRPNMMSRPSSSFQHHTFMQPGRPGAETPDNMSMRAGSFAEDRQPQDVSDKDKKKKKGFKGFLQKLGGGGKKKSVDLRTTPAEVPEKKRRPDEDLSMPLAPPPSLSVLVERADRRSNHSRSPSSNSLSTPVGPQLGQDNGQRRPSLHIEPTWQQRSVSAPLVKSPSKTSLLSSSPSSSRYPYNREYSAPNVNSSGIGQGGYRRDSYASTSTGRRKSSQAGFAPGMHEGLAEPHRFDAAEEILEQDEARFYRGGPWPEEGQQFAQVSRAAHDRPGSLTNSSGTLLPPSVETPGMHMSHAAGQFYSPNAHNGDRQKTLPPLPPPQAGFNPQDSPSPGERSPDSFNAFFGERYSMASLGRPKQNGHGRTESGGQRSSTSGRSGRDDANSTTKGKSRFGIKGLFRGGNRQSDDEEPVRHSPASTHINQFGQLPDDLARARSAGPQWDAYGPGYGQSDFAPGQQPAGRQARQPYDERARRTFYQ